MFEMWSTRRDRCVIALAMTLLATNVAAQPVPLREAPELLQSLGVVTHLDYRDTPYVNLDRVLAALKHLGVRTLRDMVPDASAGPYERLASQGYRFNFVVRGGVVTDLAGIVRSLEDFERRFPGSIAAIEGLNEANLWPAKFKGLGGMAATRAIQCELFARLTASVLLRERPVFAPTLGGAGARDFDRLGDLSDCADMGNAHVYFGTKPPAHTWTFATQLARRATPRLADMVVTETGYASAGARGTAVDEVVQAKYLLTLLANAWHHGTRHIYLYQLVDDKAEPRDWSRNLGLYRSDWSAKPAATALHHLTSALARAGAQSSGAVPELELVDAPAGTASLWLRGARESLLLVWREQPLWDDAANTARVPRMQRLRLAGPGRTLTRIDPLTGAQLDIAADASGFSVDLGGHPLLLRLN